MITLPRWLASAVLAAGVGVAGFTPAPAQAQNDDLVRVIVDIADVVLRGGQPYYRYGDYGYDDRYYGYDGRRYRSRTRYHYDD